MSYFSVRIFDGSYETTAFPTRDEAEAYVVEHVERNPESSAPVIVEVHEDRPLCKVCGRHVVTSKDPVRYPYCKNCHYVGSASEDIRSESITFFRSEFPDHLVSIDHTGGGCFWMSIRSESSPAYYALTEGEAGLPTDTDGNPVRGGWGAIGFYADEDDDGSGDDNLVYYNADWYELPETCLTDAQAVEAIRAHMKAREAGA